MSQTVVWDLQVRLFHWSLAGFFFLAYLLEGDWPAMHSHAGYTVALLVSFRLIWGGIGSRHARFGDFVAGPGKILEHLGALLRGRPPRFLGHDPAGGAMVLLLLASLLVTAISGMGLFAMEGSGPLAGTPVATWPDRPLLDVHRLFSDVSLALIVLHVIGVGVTSVINKENLLLAMISGRKREGPR